MYSLGTCEKSSLPLDKDTGLISSLLKQLHSSLNLTLLSDWFKPVVTNYFFRELIATSG